MNSMREERKSHILIILGILFIIVGMISPFYLTRPLGDAICNATTASGWCAPTLDLFVFFGIVVFFALVGIGLIFVALRTPGKKVSTRKKNS